jgi:peptide/nickel transport system permease protein
MTEARAGTGAGAGTGIDPGAESDEFGRFAARLCARPGPRWAVIVLVLLFAAAIYAPLLANDRPYVLESIDIGRYEDARRSLAPVLESLSALIATSPEEYARQRGVSARPDRRQAVAAERLAAENRLSILSQHLSPEDRPLLDECRTAIARACTQRSSAPPGSGKAARNAARDAGAEAVALAHRIERELAPADPKHPQRGGKVLHSRVTHPVLDALSPIEVFFMVAWAILMAWPAWNPAVDAWLLARDPARIRRARARKLAGGLALPLLAALIWTALAGGQASFAGAPFKSAIARGELIVKFAVFPPLAMGFAETHLAEANRPPTWLAAAEMSEEGHYVHGSRAPKIDAITGFRPPPTPVEVRAGEPDRNAPLRHPLGTDSLGRDLLARLVWGARTSLSVGLLAAVLLTALGTVVGAVAGYCGGWIDRLASRGIEIVLCVPAFFLILSVLAFTDSVLVPPILAVVAVIACVSWTGVARLVRAEFLRLRELEFVLAARALGCSPARIVLRHMLPNALGPVLVAGAFAVASSTLYESALSFLGLGIGEPIPSWGALINDSHSADQWWIQVFPGLCLFATVLAYNLLGEGIRDALDPRSAEPPSADTRAADRGAADLDRADPRSPA